MISIDTIKTFLSLLQTENFNQTAEKLNVTQSTVSARITKLEQFLGVELFKRGKFGTKVTSRGIMFKPHAVKMMDNWEEAINFVNAKRQYKETLSIATQFSLSNAIIGSVVEKSKQLLPTFDLYIEPNYSTTMIHLLRNRETDISIMYQLETKVAGYESVDVGKETFVMVSSDPDCDYKTQSHIFVHWCNGFRNTYAQIIRQSTLEFISFGIADAALEYLKNNSGTMYVPLHYLNRPDFQGVYILKDAPIIKQNVVILYHRYSLLKNECIIMADILKQSFLEIERQIQQTIDNL